MRTKQYFVWQMVLPAVLMGGVLAGCGPKEPESKYAALVRTQTIYSSLHAAAAAGDVYDVIRHMRAFVSSQSIYGDTPLHAAVAADSKPACQVLLRAGADLNAKNAAGKSPIGLAHQSGNAVLSQWLIDEGPAATDRLVEGQIPETPLNSPEIIPVIELRKEQTFPSLYQAARAADLYDVVRHITSYVSASDEYRNTPLHLAAASGSLPTVELLWQLGSDLRAVDGQIRRPVRVAAAAGHFDMAMWLLQKMPDQDGADRITNEAITQGRADILAKLIDSYPHLRTQGLYNGLPLLYMAAQERQSGIVELLLNRHFDPNAPNVQLLSSTPLHVAVRNDDEEIALLLLKAGADPNIRNASRRTPFTAAVNSGNQQLVRLLHQYGGDLDALDEWGMAPLHKAVKDNQRDWIIWLLGEGAKIDLPDSKGNSPLAYAVAGGKGQVAKLLIDHGADVNAAQRDMRPPLFSAIESKRMNMITFLLREGADPLAKGPDGDTLLHVAARSDFVPGLELALEKGLPVDARRSGNQTPLYVAVASGCIEAVKYLVAEGADVNARASQDRRPIHEACKRLSPEIVNLLLDAGADVNAADRDGNTALHEAAAYLHPDVVNKLLKAGANVNAANKDGRTPLHEAALKANLPVVQILVENGANPAAQDSEGRTPLDCVGRGARVYERYRRETVSFLRNHMSSSETTQQ